MITVILIFAAIGVGIGLFFLIMSSGNKGGRHNQAPMSAVNAQESVSKGSVRQG
jgi:hypothetical protein